ncbi:MAG TPA: penicillin-binding transpeptidase domain-containing protein, partial [Chthoniobacterales bacterium]
KGGYEHGKYVVSFSGYLPSDRPEFVGLVVLDDAKTSNPELNYAGLVAGPIFARIAEKAARYLDLQPKEDLGKTSGAGRVALTNASHR